MEGRTGGELGGAHLPCWVAAACTITSTPLALMGPPIPGCPSRFIHSPNTCILSTRSVWSTAGEMNKSDKGFCLLERTSQCK